MKKLTKAERHKIYKRAYKNSFKSEFTYSGLCALFLEMNYDIYDQYRGKIENVNFPEIWMFINSTYPEWNLTNSWDNRRLVLMFCIEMTRP